MRTYRSAVIGCGRIGSAFDESRTDGDILTHAGAYNACASTTLIGVCDTDERRAREAAAAWKVDSWSTDVRGLLELGPEIVSVCSPDETHEEIIRELMSDRRVRAILAEKPLAISSDAAARLAREADERNIVLAVNHSRRYAPTITAAREAIQAGKIGEITSVIGYYGNGLLHNGTHWIDLLRFIFGDPVWLRAEDRLNDRTEDPSLDVELLFASGLRCYLRAIDSRDYAIFEMDVIGTRGRLRLTDSGHRCEWSSVTDSNRYPGFRELGATSASTGQPMLRLTLNAVENLVSSLVSGEPVLGAAEDGVRAIRIIEAARDSARLGRGVSLTSKAS